MVKTAGFHVIKTLDDFVWKPEIELPAGLTREYMENLDFITAKENLIFMGAVGTGKTHLATAIALKACQERHRVRFFTAASLANILLERNNKGTLNGFMTSLKKVELIVIDELGFVPLHKDAAQLMFQVISECYERKSLIITSNLEFSGWNTVLGDNRLTAALIDRLVHHSHIVIFVLVKQNCNSFPQKSSRAFLPRSKTVIERMRSDGIIPKQNIIINIRKQFAF